MNTKSKTYMQSSEFKERQGSFRFFCAAAAEFLNEFRAECRKGWSKLIRNGAEKFVNITLPLNFEKLTNREWASRAVQLLIV